MLTLRQPTTATFLPLRVGARFVWQSAHAPAHVYQKKDDKCAYAIDVVNLSVVEVPVAADSVVCPVVIENVAITASRV